MPPTHETVRPVDSRPEAGAVSLVWFRDDLRLADNPALTAAAARGPVVALYVWDEASAGVRALGAAQLWWLHHALQRLGEDLARHGIPLILRRGPALDQVVSVARSLHASAVTWNRRYGAAEIAVDTAVKAALKVEGIEAISSNGHLLYEPWAVRGKTGDYLKVYTPFARAARANGEPAAPLPVPRLTGAQITIATDTLADWALRPTAPDWSGGLAAAWTPGEAGAHRLLDVFLDGGLTGYAEDRNRPDLPSTSRLSPHLRFGELSTRQVWAAAAARADGVGGRAAPLRDVEKFHSELLWREFAYHLLYHAPDLATRNFQPRFDAFPWADDTIGLKRWQRGATGYPIVDAGMRELWQTGWMHNRVRMIVGSFLVKHLLIDWRHGERWFWDTLVDADPANNTASWQWVAGSGADAAPYFRIFNPILQGEKFDPEGDYVRRFVPELDRLPNRLLHKPWTASPMELRSAGVRLGETYPAPMIDHDEARDRALAAFETLKQAPAYLGSQTPTAAE